MDLIIDKMVELHDIHDADRNFFVEGLAGSPVVKRDLSGRREPRFPQKIEDFLLGRAIKNRRGQTDAVTVLFGERDRIGILDPFDKLVHVARTQVLFEPTSNGIDIGAAVLEQLIDLLAQSPCRPPQMSFQDLPDIHSRRYPQRIQDDIHGRAVFKVRHVLFRQDPGDDPFVPVPAGHLVAHLELALHRDEDLDHLDDAGRQLVAALELVDLILENDLDQIDLLPGAVHDPLEFRLGRFVLDPNLAPVGHRNSLEILLGQIHPLVQKDFAVVIGHTRRQSAPDQEFLQPLQGAFLDDADLVVLVLLETADLFVLDDLAALILAHAFAGENTHVHDRALDPGRHPERRVPHVAGLLAEDRPQELLLGRELRLALGGDLSHQDIPRLDFGADPNDTAFVEIGQGLVADIGDIPRYLFGTELGVPSDGLELLDVNRGVDVFLDHALADEDGVLEVVPAPGHEGDEHVATQGQLPHLRRGAVGNDIPGLYMVAHQHDGSLVHAGVLIRALIFD